MVERLESNALAEIHCNAAVGARMMSMFTEIPQVVLSIGLTLIGAFIGCSFRDSSSGGNCSALYTPQKRSGRRPSKCFARASPLHPFFVRRDQTCFETNLRTLPHSREPSRYTTVNHRGFPTQEFQ